MNIIIAVVRDIFLFIRDSFTDLFGSASSPSTLLPPHTPPAQLAPGHTQSQELEPELKFEIESVDLEEEEQTFRSAADILESTPSPQKNTVLYVGEDGVPLYTHPTIEFDGVFTTVPYGAMVMALENKGRWVRVSYKQYIGWGVRDMFFDRAAYVYPGFVVGEQNGVDSVNTLRARACIGNEFHADQAELPLTAPEYVLYRLCKKGIDAVPWSASARPRTPGTWHEILRGKDGVHITIEPKGGSVMEYTRESGEGHLAFVEAVFPDETISLSEANYPDSGIYNERVLTKEEWQGLRPVFITIG